MAIKYRIPSQRIKFVNRCILCGRIIPIGTAICSSCSNKNILGKEKINLAKLTALSEMV